MIKKPKSVSSTGKESRDFIFVEDQIKAIAEIHDDLVKG